MKISREKPEIIRIIYRQEPHDPHYGSCLWAIFDFDPGHGMLNIQSDCGDYAYKWPERDECFLRLFAGMTDDYLLHKLCGKPAVFDEKGTISRIEEYLEDMDLSERKRKSVLNALKRLFQDYTLDDAPDVAMHFVDEWNNKNSLEIDCAWELVETKYSAHQLRIVSIFLEHIAPEIRKIVSEEGLHGTDNKD